MPKILEPLELPLDHDFPAYLAWAQDLGFLPLAHGDESAQAKALFAWLDEKRARLRAMEPILVPLEGNAIDDQGALVLAVLELEREFAVNGFLTAQEIPVQFELLVHDLDDLLSAEPRFSLRVFEVLQDDLETVVAAIGGGEPPPVTALENAFLRLAVVIVQWLEWNPLFGTVDFRG